MTQKDSGYALRLVKLRAWCMTGTAKRLRLAAGLSLGDISREIGTDKATIMHWENGERRPQAAEYVGRYMSLLERLAISSSEGEESAKTAPDLIPPAPAPVIPPPEQPANEAPASGPLPPQAGLAPFAGIDYELVVIGEVIRRIESLTGHETRVRVAAYVASRFL